MVRSLYITEHWPWPPGSGGRMRPAAIVQALATLGQVDIAFLDDSTDSAREKSCLPANEPYPFAGESVRFGAEPPAPETSQERNYPQAAALVSRVYRSRLRQWLSARDYDLIWCNRISSWVAQRDVRQTPVVIDVDDLQSRLSAQRHQATGDPDHAMDAERWAQLQDVAVREADWLVVCSELDRDRLGNPANSSVVPNVYLPSTDVTATPSDDPRPRILLQGLFTWHPNVAAARRLVREILPIVRETFPDAVVWLVGLHTGQLDDLADGNVRVFGFVPDVRPYLKAADVVAVPLREGSGTRLKVLESFALGVPVVSTRLGAEGISARHGEHLLLAESSRDLAKAVIEVMHDRASTRRRVESARELVASEYGWDTLVLSVHHAVKSAGVDFRTTDASGYDAQCISACDGDGQL